MTGELGSYLTKVEKIRRKRPDLALDTIYKARDYVEEEGDATDRRMYENEVEDTVEELLDDLEGTLDKESSLEDPKTLTACWQLSEYVEKFSDAAEAQTPERLDEVRQKLAEEGMETVYQRSLQALESERDIQETIEIAYKTATASREMADYLNRSHPSDTSAFEPELVTASLAGKAAELDRYRGEREVDATAKAQDLQKIGESHGVYSGAVDALLKDSADEELVEQLRDLDTMINHVDLSGRLHEYSGVAPHDLEEERQRLEDQIDTVKDTVIDSETSITKLDSALNNAEQMLEERTADAEG